MLADWVVAGDIYGTVTITPTVVAEPAMISPYARNRYRPPAPKTVREAQQQALIIVYLDEHPALAADPPLTDPVVDQRNLSIVPHVTVIVTGTTVEFLNSDSVYHNIFSLSRENRFNLGRYPFGERKSVLFDKVGVCELFCDIHSEMNGVILAVPNNYYTRVQPDGTYRISNVPPGTYIIRTWREKMTGTAATVAVGAANSDVQLDLRN